MPKTKASAAAANEIAADNDLALLVVNGRIFHADDEWVYDLDVMG